MITDERRGVKVLLVYDGTRDDGRAQQLCDAGFEVADVHADMAVSTAAALQPNVIVLDFSADGETLQQLKDNPATHDIPVIALVELLKHH